MIAGICLLLKSPTERSKWSLCYPSVWQWKSFPRSFQVTWISVRGAAK